MGGVLETVRKNRDAFDPNHDGRISKEELSRAVSNSMLDEASSATALALTKTYDRLSGLHKDKRDEAVLSFKDLEAFEILDQGRNGTKSGAKQITKDQTDLLERVDRLIAGTTEHYQKYEFSLFGKYNIAVPDAVLQGGVGDCPFMGALAAMAGTPEGRKQIENMIQPYGEKFIVTFPTGEMVMVDKPTPAELRLYSSNNENGIWPAVMEKAYGTLLALKKGGDLWAPQLNADGCEKERPLDTLTAGKVIESINPNALANEALHQKLIEMSANSMMMTAGTGPNPDNMRAAIKQAEKDGKPCGTLTAPIVELCDKSGAPTGEIADVQGPHVYAVTKYDPQTRMVYLRNPWDGGQLLRMPLDTFRQSFVGLSTVHNPGFGTNPFLKMQPKSDLLPLR